MFLPKKTGSGCRFRLRRLRKPENPAILERNLKRKNGGCYGKGWSSTAAAAPGGRGRPQKAAGIRAAGYGLSGDRAGCGIEQAVQGLYKGQNEESFWALMNAINYALELDTRVLVPLEASSDQPDGAAPWAEHPVPAEKAKDLPFWTLHTQKGRCYLPLFTSVRAAEADKGTASRPMAEMLLSAAMQSALDSDHIDGVVIDPWTSSATLDCSLLNGLLHAGHDTSEPGEEELRAGNRAMAEGRWDDAMHFYQLSAEEGCAEGLAMMGELLYEGKGCRKSPAQARKFWKKAADAGDVAAWVALGDDAMVQGKGVGAALRAYRKAQKLCASTPDIAYMPQVCLRVAQYETQYISRKQALAQLAEAKQGFLIRQKEGDETARSWLDETERVIRQLLENESG